MPTNDGTIDVTNLVESMRSSFVLWASNTLYAAAIATPAFSWLALPVISSLFKALLNWVLKRLSNEGAMQAFFLNTAIRKIGQAHDYTDAIKIKNTLPTTATEDEYARAEKNEIIAFNNFVRITN